MSFKYKITDVSTAHITVDLGNGNWAKVPIKKGESKADIEDRIRQFAMQTSVAFDNVSDVPFAVNDESTILDQEEFASARSTLAQENLDKQELNYKEQRFPHYPSAQLQLEAMYKARQGDNTLINKVDKAIADLKTRFPKTSNTVTIKDYNAAWEIGSIDDTDPKKKKLMMYKDIQTMMG